MSNMVTRCPKCATSFRITSAQLQSAKGAVRCGSCLHIFKAQDHLVRGTAQPTTAQAVAARNTPSKPSISASAQTTAGEHSPLKPAVKPAPATTPSAPAATPAAPAAAPVAKSTTVPPVSPAPAQPEAKPAEQKLAFSQEDINRELALSGDDDFLISDDMDEPDEPDRSEYEFDGFLDLENLPKQTGSLFDREIRQKEQEEEEIDPDESWAMELLDEADEEMRLSSINRPPHTEEVDDDNFNADEQLRDADLEDERPEQQESSSATSVPFKGPIFNIVAEKSEAAEEAEDIHAQPYSDNPYYQQAMNVHSKDDSPLRAFDNSRAALLMNIMPEPVEMTARHNRQAATKRLWGGLSVLLVMVLFIQLAWLQFDNLNRTEPYRSFYESVCSILDCKLPALVDRSKIRAYNLVVRNHPKLENALIVDAILLNNASFQQPFPDLILEFSTIEDVPVAARRFKPEEYLRGELAGRSLMPQNQPVHLTLELVDPGSAAVNYHAYIPE